VPLASFPPEHDAIEPRGVAIERLLLRDVALPARLQQAIQEKLSAEQEASRMQFVLLKENRRRSARKSKRKAFPVFKKS